MQSCLFKAKITLAQNFSRAQSASYKFFTFSVAKRARERELWGLLPEPGNEERRTLRKCRLKGLLQAQASVGFSSSTESQ